MATLAARVPFNRPAWRAVARAMGQTGGASVASGILSLLATKIIAVLLGPAYVAVVSTLQQLRQTGLNAATLNGQTALVQSASALEGVERGVFLRTSLGLIGGATLAVTVALWTVPDWIARAAGLGELPEALAGASPSSWVAWLSIAILLGSVYVVGTALLNAAGAIQTLAWMQLAAPAVLVLLAYPAAVAVRNGHPGAVVALLTASGLGAAVAAVWSLRRNPQTPLDWFRGAGPWWSASAARRFLVISGSLFASGVLSSWVLIAVRARILRSEGLETGGQFDAAWAISMNQAGLVLASLQTFYLPALARAVHTAERREHIRRVLMLAAMVAAVGISVLTLAKPLAIRMLYSSAFAESGRYLQWTLIGDYLKITSWILSIPILAAAHMRAFLAADVAAWVTFGAVAVLLSEWRGAAESASIAFVAMYLVHLAICASLLWSRAELPLDARALLVWGSGLGLVALASAAVWRTA